MTGEGNEPNPGATGSQGAPESLSQKVDGPKLGGQGKPASGSNTPVEWEFNGWGVVASVLVVLGVLVIGGFLYFQLGRSTPPTQPQAKSDPTETRFHNDILGANDASNLAGEWRLARSDHKIIAYAIARCLGITEMDTMPRNVFSMLLLDLRPDGDHWWNHSGPSPTDTAALKPLTGYEAALLAISDEVARARLAATGGATDFFPYMFWFGWASVIVSALATALVTLKASLSANSYPKWSMFFGILAVVLSTAATVLTGAKQFWDPTNAYMRNETALLALRQLHAEIALTCPRGNAPAPCRESGCRAKITAGFRQSIAKQSWLCGRWVIPDHGDAGPWAQMPDVALVGSAGMERAIRDGTPPVAQ